LQSASETQDEVVPARGELNGASELAYLSATECLSLFRQRKLSPVELVSAIIKQTETFEPTINAFTQTFFDRAVAEAELAERRYMGRGPKPRKLEGIPVALKDEVPLEGQPLTDGSLAHADIIATETAPLAERVIAAGGIVHARTTTPEFCCAGFTHSKVWGVTHNPWNGDFTPGGSSGGSGASLAAGTTTLASGSDIGGSIRIPSAFSGVVGIKPSYGRVPDIPPFNLDHYCHNGPLARTVEDAALLLTVMSGPDPRDIVTLRPKFTMPQTLGGISGWKVAVCTNLGDFDVDPEIIANTLGAANALKEVGATVEEVELPWSAEEIHLLAMAHFGLMMGPMIQELLPKWDLLTPYAKAFALEAEESAKEVPFAKGAVREAEICWPLGELLTRYRILICPTTSVRSLKAGDDYVGDNGRRIPLYAHAFMTHPFNISSRCPVVAVPSGFTTDGVPTGVQIVGRTYDELSAIRAAACLQRVRPWPPGPFRSETSGHKNSTKSI
jgi:aspartyl-tRNA(Asn)/glutamyl-tRNA(Gln) amidotransferase subunit A